MYFCVNFTGHSVLPFGQILIYITGFWSHGEKMRKTKNSKKIFKVVVENKIQISNQTNGS